MSKANDVAIQITKASSETFLGLYELIKTFSDRKLMLPLTQDDIFHRAQAFRVVIASPEDHHCEPEGRGNSPAATSRRSRDLPNDTKKVIASAHLDIFTPVLAEIKSLAVADEFQKQGLGRALVEDCETEARELGIQKLFVLTYQEEFFKKLGYKVVSRDTLPEKVYKECVKCSFYNDCNEIAMTKVLGS